MATGDRTTSQVGVEILEAMGELVAAMITRAENVAQQYGVPIFFLKALHRLDCPMAMKDLGLRMGCDPSFITNIADQLEKRGLATRESDPADRRGERGAPPPPGRERKKPGGGKDSPRAAPRATLDHHPRAPLPGR